MQLSKEIFHRLKESVPFFANFSDGELLALLKLTNREAYKDGEIIFKEGTRGDSMYIIMTGCVRISKPLGGDKEEVFAKLTSGACFGEMGVIDQSPRSARATVEGGDSLILVIKEKLLRESNVLLAYKLYKNFAVMLAQRLRETNNRISDLSSEDKSASSKLKDLVKKRMEQGHSLAGADLRWADLTGIYLHNAKLENAVMVGANLEYAKCKDADFSKAKLVNGKFDSTDFSNANFTDADFTGATFQNVSFVECNLSGVSFTGADMKSTMMESLKSFNEKKAANDDT